MQDEGTKEGISMTYQIFEFYPELPFRVITKECDTLMEVYEHITDLKEHKTPYAVLRDGRACLLYTSPSPRDTR